MINNEKIGLLTFLYINFLKNFKAMKITKLLVLGALLLMGNGVAMAADWIARTAPTVSDVKAEAVNFEADHEYLLYNTGAQMFFSQGNAWGTKASGDPHQEHALRMFFTQYVPDGGTWDGKTYIFKIYSSIRSTNYAWHECFFDSNVAMFVDRGSQGNLYWEIQDMGGAKYRLKAAEANPDFKSDGTQFVGRDESVEHDGSNLSDNIYDPEAHPLSPMLTEGEGKHIDWVFYDAGIFLVYEKAEAMRAEAEGAEAEGIDISAYVALYNNPATTAEQFEQAIAELKEKRRGNLGNATADNPLSATSFIVNPDFTGNDGKTGWSGTAFGAVNAKDNAEHYEKTYNTYQTIKGLPKGVYALGVNAFYRAGGTGDALNNYRANNEASKNAKLYAFNGVDTLKTNIVSPFKGAPTESKCSGEASASANGVTYYIPNNMEAAEYYMHTLGLYANTVFNTVEEDSLTIGVRKDVTIGADWTIFDDFSLTYYGAGADAYQKWYDVTVDNFDVFAGQEIPANHTAKYVDEYDAAFAELRTVKATNKAEVLAALPNVEEKATAVADALTLNISLWEQFAALIPVAQEVAANNDLDENYRWELGDWADFDGPDALEALELTNEELQAIIDDINAKIDEARKHPAGTDVDVTDLLVNPNFTGNADGWTREAVAGGNVTWGSNCYEAWNNASFDIYQKVADAPKGIYRISVQGFYRYGRGRYQDYLNQDVDEVKPGKAPVYIYLNDNQTSFTNVYGDPTQITDAAFYEGTAFESFAGDDGLTYYYPSDMASGARAFDAGMYTQAAFGVVANDGDPLRIGVKGNSSQTGDSWAIWDNFRLTWLGYDNVDLVKPILEETLPVSEELLKATMGKSAKAALEDAYNKAKTALAGTEGEAMFNALSALLTANAAANASIAVFKELETALDNLSAAIVTAVSGTDVIAEATALRNDLLAKIDGGELEDADVEELLNEIAAMIKKLAVPEEMANASDANPVPCTSMIVNPDYSTGNNDGWTSTPAPAVNYGVAEVWNSNFDEYQVLEGLPQGTYTLTAQGFYRYGSLANEVATYAENPEANSYLMLYALVGETEYAAAMPRLAKDGIEEHTSTLVRDGKFVAGDDLAADDWHWAWVDEKALEVAADSTSATGQRIVNGMSTAAIVFEKGKFVGTEVTFVVGEDGTARIGLKKQEEENTFDSWCIWDNWQLTYYGPNSTKTPTETGIKDATDKAAVVKTEFFSVNGTRVNSTAKGIIIVKETLSNGAVKVKKVTVK